MNQEARRLLIIPIHIDTIDPYLSISPVVIPLNLKQSEAERVESSSLSFYTFPFLPPLLCFPNHHHRSQSSLLLPPFHITHPPSLVLATNLPLFLFLSFFFFFLGLRSLSFATFLHHSHRAPTPALHYKLSPPLNCPALSQFSHRCFLSFFLNQFL